VKAKLMFFRKDADRAEYELEFDLPAIPQTGDRIIVRRPETLQDIHP
jgi:hypothetical protein